MKKTEIETSLIAETTPEELYDILSGYKNPLSHARTAKQRKAFCPYTWKESMEMLRSGWVEGIKELDLRIDQIEGEERLVPGLMRDVTGDFFDVGLVVAGEPENSYYIEQTLPAKTELSVVVNIATPWTVGKNDIYNRGAVIASVIDKLRKSYFVKLVIVERARNYSSGKMKYRNIEKRVVIDTQNLYSRSMLAYMLANPAYLRRTCFAFDEILGEVTHCGNYGKPTNARKNKNELHFELIEDKTSDYSTLERAVKKINSIVKDYQREE